MRTYFDGLRSIARFCSFFAELRGSQKLVFSLEMRIFFCNAGKDHQMAYWLLIWKNNIIMPLFLKSLTKYLTEVWQRERRRTSSCSKFLQQFEYILSKYFYIQLLAYLIWFWLIISGHPRAWVPTETWILNNDILLRQEYFRMLFFFWKYSWN